MTSGSIAKSSTARARIGGSPKDSPNLRLTATFSARRSPPPTAVSRTKVGIMMVNSFCLYHHRCGDFLGFTGMSEAATVDMRRKKAPTVLDNEGRMFMFYWCSGNPEPARQQDSKTLYGCDQVWAMSLARFCRWSNRFCAWVPTARCLGL